MPPRAPTIRSRTQRAPLIPVVGESRVPDNDPQSQQHYVTAAQFLRLNPQIPIDTSPGASFSSSYSDDSVLSDSSWSSTGSTTLKRRNHIRRKSRCRPEPLRLQSKVPDLEYHIPTPARISSFMDTFDFVDATISDREFPRRAPTDPTPISEFPPISWLVPAHSVVPSTASHLTGTFTSTTNTLDWAGLDSLLGCGSRLKLMELYKERYGVELDTSLDVVPAR